MVSIPSSDSTKIAIRSKKSGREDLNLRPQRPERCALTKLRYAPQ